MTGYLQFSLRLSGCQNVDLTIFPIFSLTKPS
uniref:Uncharacterized protein n=1 Tax=Rhizophora mucronata TaxID=61149 RepID=A0A2P2MX13_RHIMU